MGQTSVCCPHCGYRVATAGPIEWPFWVKLGTGMRRAPQRPTALAWLVISLLGDMACVALAFFWDRRFWWLAGLFLLCTLWNGLAILWVDKHGKWAHTA
jgi:hypothetical protein